MAKKIEMSSDSPSIKDIEAELNAVKNSLRALQQPAPEAPKPIAEARAFAAKSATAAKPPKKASDLAQSVALFLKEAERIRLEQAKQTKAMLKAAEKQRKADMQALKADCLQQRISRLEWIKQMRQANQAGLRSFTLAFDEQCQHDRQLRLRFIDKIRHELDVLLHG